MTKQEEIREDAIVITKDQLWREGIRDEQRLVVGATLIVDGVFSRLHSQGVVIKVDRELPKTESEKCLPPFSVFYRGILLEQEKKAQQDMLKASYVAVEPLIEGEK